MTNVFAETRFDCVDRDGNAFVTHLRFADIRPVIVRDGVTESRLDVSLSPLFPERAMRGIDSFHAICLSIELIRKALRAFVAHGGTVYFAGSKTPIDIDDAAFTPISEPIDERFLAGPARDYTRIDDAPHSDG